MKLLVLTLSLFIFACSTHNELSLIPAGKGYSSLTQNSNKKYYLENTCEGNKKRFRFIIEYKNKLIQQSQFYKKYNLEIIEVHHIGAFKNPFEVKITQSGCSDRVISFDIEFEKSYNSFNSTITQLQKSFIELPFDEDLTDIKTDFQTVINMMGNNRKKYCKTDTDFVAYKKRVLCNLKYKGLYYQFLWGLIEGRKPVVNLSSSGT